MVYDAMDEAKTLYYTYKQEKNESNGKHLKNFKSIIEAIEHLGGEMFADKSLFEYKKKADKETNPTTKRSDVEIANAVREKMTGVAYIKRANEDSQKVLTFIRDQHTFGRCVPEHVTRSVRATRKP